MTRSTSVLLGTAIAATFGCTARPAPEGAAKAPLYDNLGSYTHPITTDSPEAQKYFDQGLTLSYAFNHAESIRAFKQAIALDPECAMCAWGVAFALGPNINAPITEDAAEGGISGHRAGAQACRRQQRDRQGTRLHRRAVETIRRRSQGGAAAARSRLRRCDASGRQAVPGRSRRRHAVRAVADGYVAWNYWEQDGSPRPLTNEVVASLESVLARKDDHAGAIHLYIHAVEASPNPGRAEKYADKLAALIPGAGHIVHMPGHIYLRTGRYNDASQANVDAIKVDEAYFAGDAVAGNMTYQAGYYPHNIHFFVASASLEGRRADALKAADDVRAKVHADMMRDPAMGGMMQHMYLTPLFTKVRFSLWDQVLAEPAPADDLAYARAMWHAARGLAHAAQNRPKEAEAERTAIAARKDDAALKTLYISSVNTGANVVAIGYEVLSGEIAAKQKNAGQAARHYAQAVALEDGLIYMEPPDWPIPVRQLQGAALLALGRLADAETAFRDDMKKFPDNGWSLSGLKTSLERQRRTKEAAEVSARLDQAWRLADNQAGRRAD